MKKILGLDLGTNSIGWAVVNADNIEESEDRLLGLSSSGSRIIPMDAAVLGDFNKGNSKSQTAERTRLRGVRRLAERCILRRERLLRVLAVIDFLPEHFSVEIDRYGKFKSDREPKIAWKKTPDGKYSFLFKESFDEMMTEFKSMHPDLISSGKKIPYDWTLYYLRKKALERKVSKEELAWILLSFNQKRGYYQLRGEDNLQDNKKLVKYYALKVLYVEDSGDRRGNNIWYNIGLENGLVYRRQSAVPLDWVGKIKEFIVTTDLDDSGNPKKDNDGNIKCSIRAPHDDEWELRKVRTEELIDQSGMTVGSYIYDALLDNPTRKIRGKFVHTIERKYYVSELTQILDKQKEFHPELCDKELLDACASELYRNNESHRNILMAQDFTNLFVNDILFYQRPLKSKRHLVGNCPYESRVFKKNGELCSTPLKCTSKSHPLFQEFRLWQFISNLRIYQREKIVAGSLKTDVDVTSEFLRDDEAYADLYDWMNDRKAIDQKALLSYKPFNIAKNRLADFRWNYVEDKSYPCNETRHELLARLKKAGIDAGFLTHEREESLWHILYSVSDRQEIAKALCSFAVKNGLSEGFVEAFVKMPPFESDYASYSLKAIKKLLPLMRMGRYWDENAIDKATQSRIEKLLTGEYDENINNRLRERLKDVVDVRSFRALPVWLACYVVYGRHSEASEVAKWETPDDIDVYLRNFKQHTLRNPIVEQVIMETLRVVRDIWKQEGHIDEIHVELGREMKNSSDKRRKMTEQALRNEYSNLRVKAMLTEFMNPEFEIENVRPFSPSQQETLRIYEDCVLGSVLDKDMPEDILDILKRFNDSDIKKRPSRSEILRYKLWLEQRYRSPYTGKHISLGKLFTSAYEIEHIIPQSRYFDDSFSNKVICESAVNKLKGNQLGYEFIKNHHSEKVELGNGETATIFTVEEYEDFVRDYYKKNRSKKEKLLLCDIPDKFIERQLNDSRYISKLVKGLLSNIVREDGEQEAMSKNVIVCTGGVTDRLKRDWGVTDVWNRIILPRFLRLNDEYNTDVYTAVSLNGHVIPNMPLEQQRGFSKKRIDHRHHAMDAIVIACANRNIVNYLNNQSAMKDAKTSRYDLQHLLCDKVSSASGYSWVIRKPWETFTNDLYLALCNIVVSFKQNLRVINRTTNSYQHYNNVGKKVLVKQTKGDSWAIRKPMHKDTVFGEINLRREKEVSLKDAIKNPMRIIDKHLRSKLLELLSLGLDFKAINKYFDSHKEAWNSINFKKIAVYYFTKETKDRFFASRKPIDISFDVKKIEKEVADSGIQKILLNHLFKNGNNPNMAFSPDGIEQMNQAIVELNNGKWHQPIYKVRLYKKADKFPVGQQGNKCRKFVVAAKDTNLFFAVYGSGDKRSYASIPLNVVIEREKSGLAPAPDDDKGDKPLFVLSPNDLVYLPKEDEIKSGKIVQPLDKDRIYKMVSCTGGKCFFIKSIVASPILDKKEFSPLNKMEKAITGEMIKQICIPIIVDRLGNVSLR